jgi:hypothetical protein
MCTCLDGSLALLDTRSRVGEKRGRDATDDDPQNKRQSMGNSFSLQSKASTAHLQPCG